ncbi:MAG: RagB/SusD family nutrient uptake outer membrane protein [Chitinophagaceae bacterium]
MKILIRSGILMLSLIWVVSCKKFLEEKSDKKLAVPETLSDYQALINSTSTLNVRYCGLAEVGSDNYYIPDKEWAALDEEPRMAYTWEWNGASNGHWSNLYAIVFRANLILEHIDDLTVLPAQEEEKKQLEGKALFFRAMAHFNVAQVWAPAYTNGGSNDQPGIPLRTSYDINEPVTRSTLAQTYKHILEDLHKASGLVPTQVTHKAIPGKAAVMALLARVFLSMNDFNNALRYADSTLLYSNTILNYNTLNTSSAGPVPVLNEEVIFHAQCVMGGAMGATPNAVAKVDTSLYALYHENDIRKAAFFGKNNDNTYFFKGGYDQYKSAPRFMGITVSEVLLIKAECEARLNNTEKALEALNRLLVKRWKTGTFVPFEASGQEVALALILAERRKELCFRSGLRWMDLKRFNTLPDEQHPIRRILNGTEQILTPDDKRLLWLIPLDVVRLSGILQNPR